MKQELYYPPSIVPTRIQHYLLKAAISDFDVAARYWLRIKQELRLDDLGKQNSPTTLALIYDKLDYVSASILPMVYYNLQELDDSLLQSIKSYYRYLWARNHYLLSIAQKVALKASHNGSRTTLLKGLAVAFYYAPDPALRMMNDVDILIDHSKIDNTLDDMELSYELVYQYKFGRYLGIEHSATFKINDIEADVHWQVTHFLPSWNPYNDNDSFLSSKYNNLDVLEPTLSFFHTIVHGVVPNQVSTIRWISDCYWIQKNNTIDWQKLLIMTTKYQRTYYMQIGLNILKEYIEIPIDVLNRINGLQIDLLQVKYTKILQKFLDIIISNHQSQSKKSLYKKISKSIMLTEILYYSHLAFKESSSLSNVIKSQIKFIVNLTYILIRKIKK